MFLVMERSPDACPDPVADFLTTGRTGRRNAMADILGEHGTTGIGDLPLKLEMLTTQPGPSDGGECSSSQGSGPAPCTSTQTPKDASQSPGPSASNANADPKEAGR